MSATTTTRANRNQYPMPRADRPFSFEVFVSGDPGFPEGNRVFTVHASSADGAWGTIEKFIRDHFVARGIRAEVVSMLPVTSHG